MNWAAKNALKSQNPVRKFVLSLKNRKKAKTEEMIKNKKKINKKKTIIFSCSFLGILAFIVLTNKFFGFRSPPFSWEETPLWRKFNGV